MRIALNGYFWDQPRTGSGQYLRHLLSAMSDAPVEDRFILLRPGQEASPASQAEDRRAGSPELSPLAKIRWEALSSMSAARKHHAQLLHVPYLTAPLSRRIPVVVTAHDMIPWVIPGYSGSFVVRLYLSLAAAAVKRARLIIADSDASRRDVIKVLKVPPSRVRTVYLGVEPHPAYTEAQLSSVRAKFGLPRAYAFYLGGFDTRKNVPLLLRAWRGLRDALRDASSGEEPPVLAIGGSVPQPGGVFPDVEGEAAKLGLTEGEQPGVCFIGRVSEEDKPVLMDGARLFAYPSTYEGFGLDPLEAMSVGCPVVSSSGGSLGEVVGRGGLLVPPNDEPAFRAALLRAWTDPDLRASLSHAGKAQSARFTWERTAAQTRQLYNLALRSPRQ